MTSRVNPLPLFGALIRGTRDRRQLQDSPADWGARAALFLIPLGLGVVSVVLDWRLTKPDQTIAGTALLSAALLATFSQLATWRTGIQGETDDAKRARLRLDEAVIHTLVDTFVAMVTTALMITLANWTPDSGASVPMWLDWALRIGSALGTAAFTFLGVSVTIVANLLWDAYRQATGLDRGSDTTGSGRGLT